MRFSVRSGKKNYRESYPNLTGRTVESIVLIKDGCLQLSLNDSFREQKVFSVRLIWIRTEDFQTDALICNLLDTIREPSSRHTLRDQSKDAVPHNVNCTRCCDRTKIVSFSVNFTRDNSQPLVIKAKALCKIVDFVSTGKRTQLKFLRPR